MTNRLKPFAKASPKTIKIPLRLVWVVPFVLQIVAAVGVTGYLSFRNGQKAVNELATQLRSEVGARIDQHLDSYLHTPVAINQMNVDAVELGLLDLSKFETAGRYFWKQMQVFDEVGYISYALATGEFVGAGRWLNDGSITVDELSAQTQWKNYNYAVDSQGKRTELMDVTDYKFQTEAWYTETIRAGKPNWNQAYSWDDQPETLSIAANYPIYSDDNTLISIFSVDLILSGISDFLRSLEISPSARTFILERNGLVIASSSAEEPYTLVDGEAQRLNVLNSNDPLIQATAQYLQEQFGVFRQITTTELLDFKLNGDRQFVQVSPWQDELGLDWLVVVVMPESDFMGQIYANTRTTILLCLAALLIAIYFGLITSRWIAQAVRRLSLASAAIAQGDLDQKVEVNGVQELELLSESFNRMARQLKDSFEQLEVRVAQRTAQLYQAKEAADAANRAKSDFLANMSHELRTPLNAILGFTQILNRDSSLSGEQLEQLSIINRSGEHLLSLINDILDLSKIEAGRLSFCESDFDLYRLLDTVEEMFLLRAEAKGLQLYFKRESEVPRYVRTDEQKLLQILINLLGNAIKFTQEGTVALRVSVGADRPSTTLLDRVLTLQFAVEDTGAGIASDELDHLFEPFVQTEAGRHSGQGTGLGLPISRRFVELMGGDLSVGSIWGQGTTFQFTIPVELTAAPIVQAPTTSRRVVGLAPGQPQYRLLVADDRPENRQLLDKLLTPIGFEVREAQNGREAIALWESWLPHLIWMDMRMPVVNGYEATQQIKAHLEGQATVVIALTASAFDEERAMILSAGCDDFVRKPFREEWIFEKIAQHLGVRYVYAEHPQDAQRSAGGSSGCDEQAQDVCRARLDSTSLLVMSAEWLEQLHQAALQLEAEQVMELIAQIPAEHAPLANALTDHVNNFDFGQIMNLAQPAAL